MDRRDTVGDGTLGTDFGDDIDVSGVDTTSTATDTVDAVVETPADDADDSDVPLTDLDCLEGCAISSTRPLDVVSSDLERSEGCAMTDVVVAGTAADVVASFVDGCCSGSRAPTLAPQRSRCAGLCVSRSATAGRSACDGLEPVAAEAGALSLLYNAIIWRR